VNALDDLARNPHRLARRLAAVKPSPTIAVSNRARELRAAGHDVIGLGAGEPDFDTPDHIKEAAIEAIRAGATKYTAADGTPELKAAIAAKLKRDNDFEYSAAEIIASSGAKHSIFNVLLALLNPLDEVIIPAPYWVSYPDMVRLVDAVPIIVTAGLEQGFKVTAEQIERAITAKTRLLILNSPNNPSGACYSAQELIEIGDVLVRHPQVIVLSDDIYEHVLWSGEPFVNVLNACPQLRDQVIVVNGVSKAYAMTGWRIGYAAAPEPIVAALRKIQSQSTSNPCSVSQAAAVAALNGDQGCIAPMLDAFRQRHDVVVGRLNEFDGVRCLDSAGTFYAFPDVSGIIARSDNCRDDIQFAEHLLESAGVALVPGSAFGAPGYMRISFATSLDLLDSALTRIGKALNI